MSLFAATFDTAIPNPTTGRIVLDAPNLQDAREFASMLAQAMTPYGAYRLTSVVAGGIPGSSIAPSRVAIVDPTTGNDATGSFGGTPFQTISAALLAGAGLPGLSIGNPAAIMIVPGTYAEALTLISNVHLSTIPGGRRSVVLTGAIAWTPGAGVNAPQTGAVEFIGAHGINFNAAISIDASGKAANFSILETRDCGLSGGTHIGRAGLLDYLQLFDCISFGGVWTLDRTLANIYHSFTVGVNIIGPANVTFQGHQAWGPINVGLDGLGAICALDQTDIFGPVACGAGAFTGATGSLFTSFVTSLAGASVDIRGSEYLTGAQLVGPGPIDRSLYRLAIGPTVPGPNVVGFGIPPYAAVPPYLDALYAPVANETTLPFPGAPPVGIAPQNPAGFTLNDPVGGRKFDVLIAKE